MSKANWREALGVVIGADNLLIALDFDGTLAPLVDRPEDARLLPELVPVLEQLMQLPATDTALISGRAGDSLAACAEVPRGMRAVGSHGSQWGSIEIDKDGTRRFHAAEVELTDRQAELLAKVNADLETIASTHPGTHVERKPAGAALHVRQADSEVGEEALAQAAEGPASYDGVYALGGKAVLELSVVRATKGEAIAKLAELTGASACLYAGDDETDEHAFQAMANLSIDTVSIKVGEGESVADVRLADPSELAEALSLIARERHAHHGRK